MESESNFRYIWTEWIVPLVNDIYIFNLTPILENIAMFVFVTWIEYVVMQKNTINVKGKK